MSKLQSAQGVETDELLSTKFALPRLRSPLVSREPLLARLDQGLDHKLTMLSAPAGFGKTTLVGEWVRKRMKTEDGRRKDAPDKISLQPSSFSLHPFKVAWISLDAGDNDPVRFWRYVITATQTFDAAAGNSALTLLHKSQQSSFEAMLTIFINELAQLPSRSVLILEDYHVITSRQVHETLTFLLDHLPNTLHLMLITRSDPPLPLARLRGRGDLYELRAADLRFSPVETETFLRQTLPFPLSAEAIQRLEAHTEGWVAGLRLVALALQGRQEPQEIEQFLATFAGSHRHILEYLASEVLTSQPAPLQEFLLQTSFLSRLTASLAEAVTGRSDSGLLLAQLEQANLFLVSLDGAGQWYRYHAMFAEAMQQYARRRFDQASLHDLYHKASLWYEQHGLLAEAVETSLAALAFSRAAALIEQTIKPQLIENEYYTLRRWLEQLPQEVLQAYPTLCFTYAVAIQFTSDRRAPGTAELLQMPLQMAEQHWQAEGDWPKLGKVLAFRSLVCWLQGDFGPAFAAARQALELLLEADVFWRGISQIFIGVEELWAGQLTAARQTLMEALALCKTAENPYGAFDTALMLGQVCVGQGELRQAAQFYRQVLAEVEQAPMEREQALIRRGRALAGLSALDLEWNVREQAEQAASEGLDLGQQYADEELLAQSSMILAWVQHAGGETAQAQQLLHELVTRTKRPLLLRAVQADQARLALAAGDLAAVQRWSTSRVQLDGNLPRLQQEREALILARLLLAQDQAEAALHSLEEWQAEAHAQGRSGSELEILALKALAYFSHNNLPQASQTLSEALALALPEGYQRLFLDEGQPMAALLQAIIPEVSEAPLLTYIQTLLAAFPKDENGGFAKRGEIKNQKPLIEPLSAQEERVLRLLAGGLSNQEIAQELIVSLNTIKTQVKSIYRKLQVHSRREARNAARRLNLV